MTSNDLIAILPLIVLVAWAIVLLLVDLWIPREHKSWTALLAALGISVSLGLSLAQMGSSATVFNGMLTIDGMGIFLSGLFLVSGLVAIAIAYNYLKRMGIEKGEYYPLVMFSLSGMILMGFASDLIVVFLALELLSIPLYILSGFARSYADSEEAALKYFLLGAFSSGFVLYGSALVFGATAHTDLSGIVAAVNGASSVNTPLLLGGAALILVGMAFKMAAVPFHNWAPDVYQGAPTSVTAFMAVGAKAAGIAALLRVFITAFPSLAPNLSVVIWVIAALTMVVGNVVAIAQTNIKRMLAYSSIAHGGYLLMAFVAYGQGQVVSNTVASVLFYLVAYAVTSFGAWAVVSAVESSEGVGQELTDYAGIGRKYPILGIAMTVFMLSFAGVPPTLGFWGKFYLFRTAVEGGYASLALIGLLTSLVSAYYYLRVVVMMFMREGEPKVNQEPWLDLTVVAAAVAVVVLSLVPGPLFDWAAQAVLKLF